MEQLPFSLFVLFCTFSFALAVFILVAQWKVYEKAGQPGWACIIPIYNAYVLLKIVGKPGWWLLLMLIPGVNVILSIWVVNLLSKSFGKDVGFTVGMLLLSPVFIPILGFGSARYQGPYGDAQKFREYQDTHQFDFERK